MKFKYTDCRFPQTVMATNLVVPEETGITERDEFVSLISNILYEGYTVSVFGKSVKYFRYF